MLVDFWTYTCINWLRTLPYVRAWAQRYPEDASWSVCTHPSSSSNGTSTTSVERCSRSGIEYPVVIDNDYAIWRAFKNQYWPALYLIDARGRVSKHQFGEGEGQRSEAAIQRLLAEAGVAGLRKGDLVPIAAEGVEAAADWDNLKSPETYVGYDRAQNFASRSHPDQDRRRVYSAPARLALNQWALGGEWTMGKQATALSSSQGGWCTAFTRATFISSWDRHGRIRRCGFACQSTGSRRAPLTAWTWTRAATARSSNSGCIS